jgi:uncharacterized membrane-anchored protein YhcB (DUF1043 family)
MFFDITGFYDVVLAVFIYFVGGLIVGTLIGMLVGRLTRPNYQRQIEEIKQDSN